MEAALARLFERQHGVASTRQALELGETYETIARRVANHDWSRPLPRIVQPAGALLGFAGRLTAAQLAIGGDFAFGGLTAAAIWDVPGAEAPTRVHVVVPDERRVVSSTRLFIQRRSALLEHTFRRNGWPVVSLEAALVGASPELTFVALVDTLQDLLRLGRTRTDRLLAQTGRGIKGSAAIRAAVAIAGDGYGSDWERRLAALLRARLPHSPQQQYRIESPSGLVAYVDLAFPDAGLAVEIDGYVAHSRPAEFRRDRVRQNEIVTELDWTVLRYTPYEIARCPERVVRQISRCHDRLLAGHADLCSSSRDYDDSSGKDQEAAGSGVAASS